MRTRKAPQIFYTLGELARMSGVSQDRVETLLVSNGVRFSTTGEPIGRRGQNGRKRIVFLSELERAMPELVDSVRFRKSDED